MRNDKPDHIPVTVVMRSHNDAGLLPRTLAALDAQRGVEITLAVFESASTDGSKEIFEQHGPARIEHLAAGSYRSARVLNRGVREAETEVVVFLNSDAVLQGDDVLQRLAARLLASETTAGVFARQTPRADADLMTRLEYAQAFDRRSELGAAAGWMTLVCSAIRRSVWQRVAFDERLTFAEDAVWSEAVRALGYDILYVPEAAAEHSHNYSWGQRYRRAYGDAAALAVLPDAEKPGGVLGGLILPWAKRAAGLSARLCARLQPWGIPLVAARLWPQIKGEWRGAKDGWLHFHGPGGGRGEQPVAK